MTSEGEGKWTSRLVWLKAQVWAMPVLISAVFGGLGFVMLQSGLNLVDGETSVWWLYSGDARTARNLLGTILSGMITMTSLVVSMTFVVLTLAANQLGPRLIVILTSDRQVQAVLGLFVGTIVYVLVVFRTMDDTLGKEGIPHAAVTLASALTFVCLIALLFYVHKVSRLIIADVVVERVSHELCSSLEEALVESDEREDEAPAVEPPDLRWLAIGKAGYIQTIDYGKLVELTRALDTRFHVRVRPGHFLLRNGPHVGVQPNASLSAEDIETIRSAFEIGSERSPAQDIEFGIRQLVESGTRALSPGTRDPFTVIAVIDKLGRAVEMLAGGRRLPSPLKRDGSGKVRVVADTSDVSGLISAAFDQIREGGAEDPAILIHLADTIGKLLASCRRRETEEALRAELDKLLETAQAGIKVGVDRADCIRRIEAARRVTPGEQMVS